MLANYRIPFIAWGPASRPADLYALNPTTATPAPRRVGYAAERQPVRNGDLANLAIDLLGLPASRSELDVDQDLDVIPCHHSVFRDSAAQPPSHLVEERALAPV